MKKYILLLIAFLTITMVCTAQVKLLPGKYFLNHAGLATDTVGAVGTTWNYPIFVNKGFGYFYINAVKVQEVTSDFKCSIKLQGKNRSTESYSDITTLYYYGTGTDSTLNFSNVSTKTNYNYLNYLVTRISGKGKVVFCDFNIKKY